MQHSLLTLLLATVVGLVPIQPTNAAPQRARDLGVPFQGEPGACNAITDVRGVEVGHRTLIAGDGALVMGQGPVRTGVTAVFPLGRSFDGFAQAGVFVANGTGELTGRALIEEVGLFSGPVMLTGTGSVGVVRDAVIAWYRKRLGPDEDLLFPHILPVVGETYDGFLNDTFGQHVRAEDAFAAMDAARAGPVAEGSVGGGTGMMAFAFKGGIGTSSRVLPVDLGGYTVGVLVQANFGGRSQLTVAGVPVGAEIKDLMPARGSRKDGSIIAVIATDAPLLPHQLRRLALRATHGMARTGGVSGTTSGDIFLAFSTVAAKADGPGHQVARFADSFEMNPLLEAVVLATEEAIINSLVANTTMTGVNGNTVQALPHDRLQRVLRDYGRPAAAAGPTSTAAADVGTRAAGPSAGDQCVAR
jgi:L-aminopeptidase/D-esterase-like protein